MSAAYLIAGAGGMLGTALQRVMTEADTPFLAPAESSFDITDTETVRSVVEEFASQTPDGSGVLINAAAYTNVEGAEDQRDLAYRVNEHGARLLAQTAKDAGLRFAHVSTDFVFDGKKTGPYSEDDAPNPLSVYGQSKLAGEIAVTQAFPQALIVRTAWVYGLNGVNFPLKILRFARERDRLSVVTDEVGSPTYTVDLARGIIGLIDANASGLYHLAGEGSCSRFELAEAVLESAGIDVELTPTTAATFPSKAPRPSNSVLDCSKAGRHGVRMPRWQDGVERYVSELVRLGEF